MLSHGRSSVSGVVRPQPFCRHTGGAFLDEIFTFAFNSAAPGGTLSANGQVLPIAQNTAVYGLIGTTYGGNGTTNFAISNLGGVTMIGTGQGPGLSPEQLGVPDGTSSVTLTRPELPPDLGGTTLQRLPAIVASSPAGAAAERYRT